MKEELQRRIMAKEDKIKELNLDIDNQIHNLKQLTFNEYAIEEYVIRVAELIKEHKKEITRLQFEVYELMQILKTE